MFLQEIVISSQCVYNREFFSAYIMSLISV